MFNVYAQHQISKGTSMIIMPQERSIEGVRLLAEAAANLGHNVLYRAFEVTSDSVTGEQFETSFSVLNGVVREHKDVTIPREHW